VQQAKVIDMPTTKKGAKIKRAMKKQYGAKKGEQVFHASKNKGTIKGVEKGGSRRKRGGSKRKSSGRSRSR
jgi:hypothetical protein